ncbi:antibiotic biosynthesis monooxygenase [Shewanella olleyana]|uniref:putative quinol monooxygenase n=1 Tax=Shewanella olleyana TaxID=135626 RepID=UPI00200F95CC|nr:putative quinol monooxygenase [Shewanella olleyana]MCL1065699.1 antibiotic biosynthesis monooxygenase [Shewanella olleyana]
MAFTQILKFTVKPESRDKFVAALMHNKQQSAQETGNIAMRLYVDNSNTNVLFAYDRWQDEEALNYHLQQTYTQKLLALAETTLAEPIDIQTLHDSALTPVAPLQADKEDPRFNIFFIFKIKPGTRDALLAQFEKHITHTRTEPGCLLFDLYTVQDDPETLVVYEHWRKESDVWDIHFHQPYAVETGKLMEESVVGDMQQYMHFVTQLAE